MPLILKMEKCWYVAYDDEICNENNIHTKNNIQQRTNELLLRDIDTTDVFTYYANDRILDAKRRRAAKGRSHSDAELLPLLSTNTLSVSVESVNNRSITASQTAAAVAVSFRLEEIRIKYYYFSHTLNYLKHLLLCLRIIT